MHRARLTRIRLNLAHPAVRRDLADYVGLHKTLMRLATHDPGCPHPRRDAGLLFRLETDHKIPLLFVQTKDEPELDGLPRGYGATDTIDLTPVLQHLDTSMRVRYRITANASVRTPAPHSAPASARRGPVIALDGPDALAWWHRRATRAGLTLETATLQPRPYRRPRGAGPGPHHRLTQFDGTALITDAHALAGALVHGIGRGLSYGAGLLSLAPA
ncbi:type I-E CRISPR-associated protein Cas6/Cse3/CasE [Streptomyces sp. NPDC059544]|uniref:type I-E CRISPR-associated protein Cas6/Cse3/CasE n=1 Tax=Streptomyces sp. NPDC059544 TaxID=3346861 RepID=UPI0036B03E15